MLAPQVTHPARLCWERCRGIHPMHIPRLCAAFIDVLAKVTGIEPDRMVYEPLRCIRAIGDLARFSWSVLCEQLHALVPPPAPRLEETIAHLQLFAELAVVHHHLYLSRSGSTLQLLGRCRLPFDLPPELSTIRDDFGQLLARADRALQAGRATLAHFGRQVAATHHPLPALLCTILARARSCYQRYRRAIRAAIELVGCVAWYLSWKEEPPSPLSDALSAPLQATRTLQPVGHPARKRSTVQTPARRKVDPVQQSHLPHPRKRGGITIIMPNAPAELSAFCSTCPAAQEVTDALAPLGFALTFFMEQQVFPAYSATPPIPPQYHYRQNTDGTEVIYLEGRDAGDEEERLPPHASRFWIYAGSAPHTMHLVAQLCATKWRLSWNSPRSEAIA